MKDMMWKIRQKIIIYYIEAKKPFPFFTIFKRQSLGKGLTDRYRNLLRINFVPSSKFQLIHYISENSFNS